MTENEYEGREALFAAVEGGPQGTEILSCRPLVRLFSNTAQRSAALESIQSHKFHKGHARRFFAAVGSILKTVVDDETYVPSSAYQNDDNDHDDDDPQSTVDVVDPSDIEPDAKSSEALSFLKASAQCVDAYLEGLMDRRVDDSASSSKKLKLYSVIDEAFAVAELLHQLLFPLQACGLEGIQVQTVIASMCENWWHQRFADRECMIVQLVPTLLARSLEPDAPKADLKRVVALREAIDVLDFEDESIGYVRSLLRRTVSNANYVRSTEGIRFIASLFHLHPSLLRDLHQSIRNQIPDAKRSFLKSYGEIYFRAWKDADTSGSLLTRTVVEENALHDLMLAILHLSNATMRNSIHIVLEPFHFAKKTPEVEDLLHRMYGPILWRSLGAANPGVRVNAAAVLAEVFPLRETSADPRAEERAVTKSVDALKTLLVDADPRVRVAASEATAMVLITYWDVLPTTKIRVLLNHIVAEHASDASSSAVRAAALTSINMLLDAEETHAVLRAFLPSLGNLIHDKVERVRLAAVRLLFRVKQIKGIKYYHVVPVEHLTARLADEGSNGRNPQGPVASALTALMLNSYYPQGPNVTGAEKVRRTLLFLSTDPAAALAFYSNIAAHLNVGSVAKLAAMLLRCLCSAVETDKAGLSKMKAGKKRRRYGTQDDDKVDGGNDNSENDEGLTAANTSLMAFLAETICALWESIEIDLREPENEPSNEFLLEAFSGAVLTSVHAHFDQKAINADCCEQGGSQVRDDCYRTCAAILRCAGRLPPKAVEGLASTIASKLATLREDIDSDAVHESITPHVALLCLWGMTEDVASSLSLSIKGAFGVDDDTYSPSFDDRVGDSKKRRSTRLMAREDLVVPALPARVALEVLRDILRGPDPSSVAAREAILSSSAACHALEKALELGTVRAERLLMPSPIFRQGFTDEEVELLLKACETFGRFALHKEASRDGPLMFNSQAKTLLDWTTDRVIPVLRNFVPGAGTPFGELNISRISSVAESPLHPSSPSPMPPPKQRMNRNSTPLRFSTSFGSVGHHGATTETKTGSESHGVLAHGAAVSLLQTSCIIFSEWLAVGGSGAEMIAESASKWSEIFSSDCDTATLPAELLPAFLRLSVQLCKSNATASLLQNLMIHCSNMSDEAEEFFLVRSTVSSLLKARDNQGSELMGGILDAVLNASHELLLHNSGTSHEKEDVVLPEKVSDLWESDGGSFMASLLAVLSNKQATFKFAEKMVAWLGSKDQDRDENHNPIALFHAKCLYFMCDRSTGNDKWDVTNAVRSLSVARFQDDSPVRDVLDNMMALLV